MRYLPLALLLAWAAAGADYPASAGYMNDLTGVIPDAVQQALELRLRAYERATSNEVAVAVVPSLQGESVDDYARGLFRAWKIGKAEKNNGVLFLWAPNERQLRIQVGYGLENVLTNQACTEILNQATVFFRQGSGSEGVRSVVDGIIQRLGEGPPAETPPQASGARVSRGDLTAQLLLAGIALLSITLGVMLYHTRRTHQYQQEVPASILRADHALHDAGALQERASADLKALQEEAPPEVWQILAASLEAVPEHLHTLRADLDRLSGQRREEYREWHAAHRALRRWNLTLEEQTSLMTRVSSTLRQLRDARDASLEQIPLLPERLSQMSARLAAGESNEQKQKLLDAAQGTFDRVRELRQSPPVNWLLVYDLLDDAQSCLRCLDVLLDPEADARKKRAAILQTRAARFWSESATMSPAGDALVAMAIVWSGRGAGYGVSLPADFTSSGGSSFDGGGGGGGGFGGGDTGGGGASAGY